MYNTRNKYKIILKIIKEFPYFLKYNRFIKSISFSLLDYIKLNDLLL